ncbi:MAG TPA: hypothetical protein VL460_10300 [Caulobacteraceae bacterium]|jgi:hypothetical protein|nr:hypothetical protein [Caulobacteraceae bacterium]
MSILISVRSGSIRTALTAALLGAAGMALAADRLPLKIGLYVRAEASCKDASNADTLSYWGGAGGINNQQDRCTAHGVMRRGKTYTLTETCENVRFGGSFRRSEDIEVQSTMAFRAGGQVYRWCRSKAAP